MHPYMFMKYICRWYEIPYDCSFLDGLSKQGPWAQEQENEELIATEESEDIGRPCTQAGNGSK